jgi:hypothetical protein
MSKFKVGEAVKMTTDALENYGNEYAGMVFIVSHVATNTNQHPGYDSGAGGALYDLKNFNSSLYDWELTRA